MKQVDVNLGNSILEEKIVTILDSEAPMHNIQQRTNYCKWLKQSTKERMEERNDLRELARRTQRTEDWDKFRKSRNECTTIYQ